MIKHIVFDFGGVILNLDGIYKKYPEILSEIFEIPLVETQKIWEANRALLVTGKESPKQFLEKIKNNLSLSFDIEKSLASWKKQNIIFENQIDWELIKIIKNLRANFQVHMLTDQIPLKSTNSTWLNDIDLSFHSILRSYEEGFYKASTKAFSNLLTKIQAEKEPESVVFIDDVESNIKKATEMGINTVLYNFGDHESLIKEFKKIDIKI